MSVVQPAYHSFEGNRGQGSFLESGRRRLSCERVFMNSKGYVMDISTAPAVMPARMERVGLGFELVVGEVEGVASGPEAVACAAAMLVGDFRNAGRRELMGASCCRRV